MYSNLNTVKCDVVEALLVGTSLTAKEIASLVCTPEIRVEKALSELTEKGCVCKSSDTGHLAYSLKPGTISVVCDLCADPAVFFVCHLSSGKSSSVMAPIPDRCDRGSFMRNIAKSISSYVKNSAYGGDLRATTFLYDGSLPASEILPPDEKTKLLFWRKDELAARLISKEIKSELTLFIDLSGEEMKAYIFRPDRRYEIPISGAADIGADDPQEIIIRNIKALHRAFRPDAVYISDPLGGSRLESGIMDAIRDELGDENVFCSALFSHSFEKALVAEAARVAIGIL